MNLLSLLRKMVEHELNPAEIGMFLGKTPAWVTQTVATLKLSWKYRKHRSTNSARFSCGINGQMREFIFRLNGKACQYCGISDGVEFHIEHIVPRSKGGANTYWNLAVACEFCNARKGTSEEVSRRNISTYRTKKLLALQSRAIELYKQGMTTREVGDAIGRSHSWVAYNVKDISPV